jgi:hypothetical protein
MNITTHRIRRNSRALRQTSQRWSSSTSDEAKRSRNDGSALAYITGSWIDSEFDGVGSSVAFGDLKGAWGGDGGGGKEGKEGSGEAHDGRIGQQLGDTDCGEWRMVRRVIGERTEMRLQMADME